MAHGILIRFILTIVLLAASVAGGTLLAAAGSVLCALCFGVSLVMIWLAIRLLGLNTRKVTFMFNSIENNDYAFRFSENRGMRADRMFNRAMNRIKDLMEQTRHAIAERERYYEKILAHTTGGVIIIDPASGIVFQCNRAATNIFGVGSLTHVNQLSLISPELPRALMSVSAQTDRTVSFYNESAQVQLTLSASMVNLHERELKIVAISDIGYQIDNAQIESWTRMSRVLTHEIMNSLAPITSLSEQLLEATDPDRLHRGLQVINSTGRGLISFVESYRRLTRIPTPLVEPFELRPLVEQICSLYRRSVDISGVRAGRILSADRNLIGQVITNLVKNAHEALGSDSGSGSGDDSGAMIWIKERTDGKGRQVIEVCNNGAPIASEVRENIFVPFFTTRTGGSGIGLSLSRQIMRLHGGTISCTQVNHVDRGVTTVFTLNF